MFAGQTEVQGIMTYSIYSGTELDHVTWSSSNPSVAQPSSPTDDPYCLVTAISPGTATITGTVYFYMTRSGYTLSDTFSFDVTVEPSPNSNFVT